jgi:uncharacterized membrane protein
MKEQGNLELKSDKDSFVVSVVIALLIAAVLIGVYFVALRPVQEEYMTIYLLDSQKKAISYPEQLVANENNTFVYVTVENHNDTAVDCQVQIKVAKDMTPTYPANVNSTETFSGRVQDGATWENGVTLSLNQPGFYMVIFELWIVNNGVPQFSGEFTQLNIQVVNKAPA